MRFWKMSAYKESEIVTAATEATRRLGYNLRDDQMKVIVAFCRGQDVFLSLPTGSGKSLCYSCLPWTFDILRRKPSRSIVIVVSPLIALMKDQVSKLTAKGVKSVFVTIPDDECDDSFAEELHEGSYQVVFFSPESLLTVEAWRDMLVSDVYRGNVVGFIVDEAYCVKKW